MTPEEVKNLRTRLGVTQRQLAEMIGATQVTIARYETGVSKPTGAYLMLLKQLAEKVKKAKGGKHG